MRRISGSEGRLYKSGILPCQGEERPTSAHTVPGSVPDDFVVRLVEDPVRTGIIGPGGNVII